MIAAAPGIDAWSDLFVATAGASAALAGLVFVAVSINVDRILKYHGLPERGLITVLLLLSVVVVSLMGLVPDQSTEALGLRLLITSVVVVSLVVNQLWRARPRPGDENHLPSSVVVALVGTLPFLVGAIVLFAGEDTGLYWIFAGLVSAMVGGVANAWVLLVEILR